MKKIIVILGCLLPLFAQDTVPQAKSYTVQEVVCRTNIVQITVLDGVTNRTVLRTRVEERPNRPFIPAGPGRSTNRVSRPVNR